MLDYQTQTIVRDVYHVVISNATMISSLRMSAVNEIATICRNSFSKSTRDIIMIAAPKPQASSTHFKEYMYCTYLDRD